MSGCFYGVGVGTGDPELLTLKAVRLIQSADIICYLKTESGQSLARDIASQWIDKQTELPIHMPPMSIQREQIKQAYDQAAIAIAKQLEHGKQVAFLCEGDPFFFGSYIYLYQRLSKNYHCQSIAGISSIHASSALAGIPLVQQNDSLAVLSSRNSDQELRYALENFASVVIMKAGKHRQRIIKLIQQSKREKDSCYIERAGQKHEKVEHNINNLTQENGDYFSLFLIVKNR